jgi:putative flavoprotein involved in K+ transport
VWHDARHIAEHIVKQRLYFEYRDAAQRQAERESATQPASRMGAR